jgi:hypothetical protein
MLKIPPNKHSFKSEDAKSGRQFYSLHGIESPLINAMDRPSDLTERFKMDGMFNFTPIGARCFVPFPFLTDPDLGKS